jgi:hypothetical protein
MMNIEGETPNNDSPAPVGTDAGVLDRVNQVVGQDTQSDRLCLLFLAPDYEQLPVVVLIDDVPAKPDPGTAGSICDVIANVLDRAVPGTSAVVALVRPNCVSVTDADMQWLMTLKAAAERTGLHLRMLCLATSDGVRRLDSLQPGAVSQSAEYGSR